MELRQLECFVAVAEECHFTRAAGRLHVAQSGLSATIRALERELGAPLFVRSTRQVRLTPAGRALLAEARRALAAAGAARDAVAAAQGLLRGSLSVGTLQCQPAVDLPGALARFVERHPGMEIHLRQGGSDELTEQVRTGELDLALVQRPAGPGDGLTVRPLAAEPLVLACAPGRPLAGREAVAPHELTAERFVDFPAGWGTRDLADRVLGAAGAGRRVPLEVTDVHALLDLVGLGLGVALVPRHFSRKTDRARFLPLTGRVPQWEVVAVTGRPASPGAAALLREFADAPRAAQTVPAAR